jgi:hypothetical protein
MTDRPSLSPTDRVVELLCRRRPPQGSVVVDLGRNHEEVHDALVPLGLGYLAAGPAATEIPRLVRGGIEVVGEGLATPRALFTAVRSCLGERPVAGVVLGDAPSRVLAIGSVLDALRAFCIEVGNAPIVAHVANVTHLDVAATLLLGRWDAVPGGIVSPDQVRQFSDRSLHTLMAQHGFSQMGAADVRHARLDGPCEDVPLERTTSIGMQLSALRQMADSAAFVTHFVRMYEPVQKEPSRAASVVVHDNGERVDGPAARPFLSVLLRTQGKRPGTLQESLLCLAAQSCDDFEVLVLLHNGTDGTASSLSEMVGEFHPSFAQRVRVVEVYGGGRSRPLNEGALVARGRYLAMLDDDDLVFAHWVESFREGAEQRPLHMVRVPIATQQVAERPAAWDGHQGYEVVGRPRLLYPLQFDHLDHILDNRTPNNGYAVPRSFVVDLGQGWDESLPVLEDWDHLLRAASMCGVVSVPNVTGLVRSWTVGEDSKSAHSAQVWERTRRRIVERNDQRPLVLDLGSFSKIRELGGRLDRTDGALHDAYHRIHLMHDSTSWRLTRPIRVASRGARAIRRRLRRRRPTDAPN